MTDHGVHVFWGEEWLDVGSLATEAKVSRKTVLRRVRTMRLQTFRTRKGLLVLADEWRRSLIGESANDDESMDAKAG